MSLTPVIGPSVLTYTGKDGKKHHSVSLALNFLNSGPFDSISIMGFQFQGVQFTLSPQSLGAGVTAMKFHSMMFTAGFQTPQTQVDSDSELFIFSKSTQTLIKLAPNQTPPVPAGATGDLFTQVTGCVPLLCNVHGDIIIAKAINATAGLTFGWLQATFFDEELPAWIQNGYYENALG